MMSLAGFSILLFYLVAFKIFFFLFQYFFFGVSGCVTLLIALEVLDVSEYMNLYLLYLELAVFGCVD